ncbi:MAG TPA: DUF6660 family protein [Daejeonella sp.]
MKLLAIIMSFLLLAMVMTPCQEETEVEKDSIELTSKSTSEKHNAPEDNCNAFCHCARCPFSVVIPATDQLIADRSLSFVYRADLTLAIKNISFAIWQPPKLA